MLVFMWDAQEKVVSKPAVTVANGQTLFTVAGGPILIKSIGMLCVTANAAVASTVQWSVDGTDGAATTITGASASLISAAAGTLVIAIPGTLATGPGVYVNGAGISGTIDITCPAGIITCVVGVGTMTGTWSQFMRYVPLAAGVVVS